MSGDEIDDATPEDTVEAEVASVDDTAPTLAALDEAPELTPEQAAGELCAALGDHCQAIYLIGSDYARGPLSSQGRLLVLVDALHEPVLDRILSVVARCEASRLKVRMDTTDNILRGSDTFPGFALELKQHRKLLHGADTLAHLTVDLTHLRLHVEHGFRGIQRELVANYLAKEIKGWQVPELRRAVRRLIFLFEGLLLCGDAELPDPATPTALIGAVRGRFFSTVEDDVWQTLQAFAGGELPPGAKGAEPVYRCLFKALPTFIDVADTLE